MSWTMEREVKFLVREHDLHPSIVSNPDRVFYLQAYLPKNDAIRSIVERHIPDINQKMQWQEISTIRIRKEWDKHVLAIKWKRSSEWTIEIETEIDKSSFDEMLSYTNEYVEKDRLIIPIYQTLRAEIDFYRWRFKGVISIEVEYSEAQNPETVKWIVSSLFPWSEYADDDVLTAWSMAWSKDLKEFIEKAYLAWVNNRIIQILSYALSNME